MNQPSGAPGLLVALVLRPSTRIILLAMMMGWLCAACDANVPHATKPKPSPPPEPAPAPMKTDPATASPKPGPSATAHARLPVRWTPNLDLSSLPRIDEEMRASKERWSFAELAAAEHTLQPSNCIEWMELRRKEYEPTDLSGRDVDINTYLRCTTLTWLKRAKPSKVSYVQNLQWSPALLDVLPVTVTNPTMDDTDPRAGMTVKQADPEAIAKKEPGHGGLSIVLPEEDWVLRLEPTAWADFNRDGVQDLLLEVRLEDRVGPYRDAYILVLTRTDERKPLRVLEASSY